MAAQKAFGINVLAVSKGLEQVGREVTKLGKNLEDFNRKTAKATVDVETRKAEEKLGKFARDLQSKVERAVRSLPDVQLRADSSPVDRRIAEIRRELATLSSKRIGVDVDAGRAQAQINRLSSELARLGRQSPNVQVRADTAAASAALLGVSSLARRIDGQNVAISVNASDVSRAISLVGLLTVALAGASALVAPAAAGIAALGPLAGTAAQGIGALATGFSGIGDAVKALSAEETKAAAGTAVSAASRVNSAQAIASAQRGVERAVTAADRAQIQGAQQVEDARRGLADAYEQGARQVAQAEQQLRQAQQASTDAQLDLNRARLEAIERNEDLRLSLRGVAIDEREALLDLKDAQAKLAEGMAAGVSGDELERLRLSVDRAQLGLDQTRERFGDLRQESAEYARTGVEGSREVVAAQRQVQNAAQGVRDAEAQLAQARSDSARQVADAQRQVQRAVQQASWAQQDAAAAVADAQRALSNAYQDVGTQGAAAGNKVKEAMEGLSPEAQRFARFLVGEVIPGLHGIRDAVQATLLPRMEVALRNMGKLGPVVAAGLADTGRVIGDLSVKGSEMMSSGPWQRDFGVIMASNNRVLASFGEAGLSTADSFRHLTVESGPMVERFAALTAKAAQQADTFLANARATGELDRFFDEMGDTILELVHIGGQIVTMFVQVSQALGPFGMVLLETVGNLAELIGTFAEAHPQLTQLAGVLVIGAAAFTKLGAAIQAASLLGGTALAGWKQLGGVLSALSPSGIAASATMQRISASLNAAEMATARWTDRLFTTTSAQERFNTTGARWGNVAGKIAGSLPIVGAAVVGLAIAYDQLSGAAGEAANKLMQGGDAAAQQAQALRENDIYVSQVQDSWFKWVPVIGQVAYGIAAAKTTTEEATRAMREQLAAMTPLQQAQTLAGQAANNYGMALKNHGPNSWQAATAAGALALATDDVERQQREAELATKSWTDKLIEQRDTMLGSVDAEIRYQAAVDALTESIAANGATVDLNTDQGRANMQALQEMSKAAIGHLEAMSAQGVGVDQITAKERAYRDQLFNSAVQAGMSREEARRYVDQLHLTPKDISTRMHLDTTPATRALRDWIASAQGQQFSLEVTGNITSGAVRRAAGGPIRGPGTTTSDSILARLSNNEHVWSAREVAGAGGHQRVAALRSAAAAGSLPRFAAGGAVRALPGFAAGGTPAPIAAVAAGSDLFAPLARSAEELQKVGLAPLAAELTDTTVPALEALQQHARQDTPGALGVLTQATTTSGQQIQATWAASTAGVTAAQQQQTAQMRALGTNVATTATWMGNTVAALQARHNASWADMRARSGAEVGTITGPIFGGLHRGMDLIQGHSTNMADWVGGQYARIRGLTADPIRWSLDWPLNRGLVPAWNAIDAFFQLNRRMGPVPIGFAHGTEDHRAQIARPGQMRIWNEPETHGEAYIPLAQSKRGRSTQILGTVADQFGYALEPKFFADGGLWRQMFGVVKGQFPGATLNSAYRPGDPGYHGSGRATDLGGPMMAINRWLASRFANSTELIYTPGINLWRGRPHTYNAATRADHHDHVHWSLENAAMLGGAPGFYGGAAGGGGIDIVGFLNEKLAATRRMIADIHRFHGRGNFATAMTRFGNDAVQGATDLALRSYTPVSAPGAGVERWRPTVNLALDMLGQPRAFADLTLRRMQQESGGDPNIVNRWDSNWRAGNPSVGLMQVIRGTYARYKDPRRDVGPYSYGVSVDPLSNILSSGRYAVARYGSLPAAYNKPGGYDQGGVANDRGWLWKGTVRPERMLDPRTTVAFERLVSVLDTKRGATPIIVSAPAAQAALGAAGGGLDWRAAAPVIRAAFTASLREVLGEGIKTDVDYDRLAWKLNKVAVLNQRR